MSTGWLAQIGVDPGGVALFYGACLFGPLVLLLLVLVIYLLAIMTGIMSGTVPVWFKNRSSRFRRRARLDEPVIVAYDELTREQHDGLFALRHDVFVGEQEIWSEPDRDGLDPDCMHMLAVLKGEVVGTCRLLAVEVDGRPLIKLGRLAVAQVHRRRGIGRAMVRRANVHLAEQGVEGVMHAQAHLEDWYAGFGWVREGGVFMEAGIEHVKMRFTPGDVS
jgi:ElaA protein